MKREDETTEFKERWNEGVLITAIAFANHRGGRIVVGIQDDGVVCGCAVDDDSLRVAGSQLASLGLSYDLVVETRDGKNVLVVVVQPGAKFAKYKGHYYRRRGAENRELSPEEIAAGVPGILGQSFLGAPVGWMIGIGVALVVTMMIITSILASRGQATGEALTRGQKASWLVATCIILIVSGLGLWLGAQKRFGPWRLVVLGLCMLVLLLFALDGLPEWKELGVWPFTVVEAGR
jgi:hypothetical protein